MRADGGFPGDVLVNSFVRMLGPIIPDVLPQILDAYDYYSSISESPPSYASALIGAFEYAWRNYPTQQLGDLNEPNFVAHNLGKIANILPQAHIQHKEWGETSPFGTEDYSRH